MRLQTYQKSHEFEVLYLAFQSCARATAPPLLKGVPLGDCRNSSSKRRRWETLPNKHIVVPVSFHNFYLVCERIKMKLPRLGSFLFGSALYFVLGQAEDVFEQDYPEDYWYYYDDYYYSPTREPLSVEPACGEYQTIGCDADADKSFDTYLLVEFDGIIESLRLSEWFELASKVGMAYDIIGGLACDACRRRLVDVGIVFPIVTAGIRRLQDKDDEAKRELELAMIETETTSVVFKLSIEQTGDCTAAFDSEHGSDRSESEGVWFDYCSSFVTYDIEAQETTCCCACYPQSASTPMATNDFILEYYNAAFDLRAIPKPLRALELGAIKDDGCRQEEDYILRTDLIYVQFDWSLYSEDYNKFLQSIVDAYNSETLRNCVPQEIVSAELVENEGTQMDEYHRRQLGSARAFVSHRLLGPASCMKTNSCYSVKVRYKCSHTVCPESSPNKLFDLFRRRLENTSWNVGSRQPLPRDRSLIAYVNDECLCPVDNDPTRALPTIPEFVKVLNTELESQGLDPIDEVIPTDSYDIPDTEETIVTIDVPAIVRGEDACTQGASLDELVTTTYNDLSFELCDPIFRTITSALFVCNADTLCEAENEFRGTFKLTVSAFGEFPDNVLFGKASPLVDETKNGKGGKGKRSLTRDRQLAEAFCSEFADGFTNLCEGGFVQDFEARLADSNQVEKVEGVEFLFSPQCQCSEASGTIMDGVTLVECDHRHLTEQRIDSPENKRRLKGSKCGLFDCHDKNRKRRTRTKGLSQRC